MKLVEPEAEGPVEGEDPIVTPPRLPHRRVSVSLVLTLSVLVGTVVTIYAVFPARKNALVAAALDEHRASPQRWDVAAPTPIELRAFATGVIGPGAPLPGPDARVVGARRVEVAGRTVLVVGLDVGGDAVTYLVQHARGISPEPFDRVDGADHVSAWRRGKFLCVAVAPDARAQAAFAAITRGGS